MRPNRNLLILAIGASLIGGASALLPAFAADSRGTPPQTERQWLSIGEVHQKLEAAGYRKVEKIEREHGVYEARATDRNGARVKLRIHPQTGEITDRGDRHDGARKREYDGGGKSSPDCNKRRCRDDLPAPAAAPASAAPLSSPPPSTR